MMSYIYDMLVMFLGNYTPITYQEVTYYTLSDGTLQEVVNTIVPNGIGSINLTYVFAFILFMYVLHVIYSTIAKTITYFIFNKRNSKLF